MPTLGEFIARARAYGYTRHVIRIQELHERIVYLGRGVGDLAELVDLPTMRESDRLTRTAVESLCERAGIPKEDFGLRHALRPDPHSAYPTSSTYPCPAIGPPAAEPATATAPSQ